MLLVKRLQERLGMYKCAGLASLCCGAGLLAMAEVDSLVLSLVIFLAGTVGNSVRMATNPSLVASLTDATNRGKLFGWIMMYNNAGRMIGPTAMGHAADVRVDLPFVFASVGCVVSVLLLIPADRTTARAPTVA